MTLEEAREIASRLRRGGDDLAAQTIESLATMVEGWQKADAMREDAAFAERRRHEAAVLAERQRCGDALLALPECAWESGEGAEAQVKALVARGFAPLSPDE